MTLFWTQVQTIFSVLISTDHHYIAFLISFSKPRTLDPTSKAYQKQKRTRNMKRWPPRQVAEAVTTCTYLVNDRRKRPAGAPI